MKVMITSLISEFDSRAGMANRTEFFCGFSRTFRVDVGIVP
jgi:hypothetical protein